MWSPRHAGWHCLSFLLLVSLGVQFGIATPALSYRSLLQAEALAGNRTGNATATALLLNGTDAGLDAKPKETIAHVGELWQRGDQPCLCRCQLAWGRVHGPACPESPQSQKVIHSIAGGSCADFGRGSERGVQARGGEERRAGQCLQQDRQDRRGVGVEKGGG